MKPISRWRLILVATLLLLPVVMMAGVGGWTLWTSGHWYWLSWTLPICWTIAWLMLRFAPRIDFKIPEIGTKSHWTPRDHEAYAIVDAERQRISEYSSEQLADPKFYVDRSIEIATRFARHYHPNATDPLGPVSVIELLTAAQLVAEDIENLLNKNVPGSHLITVSQWRMLAHAPSWWRTATNLNWLIAVLINPMSVARYGLTKVFVDPLFTMLQSNLLGAFYILFVNQLGFYLIELNSGRLRGGSANYREWKRKRDLAQQPQAEASAEPVDVVEPVSVKIAVIGQVKAGKSSLVNCLLGEQRAAVDVLPLTRTVQRYQLEIEGQQERLILLDTPGYNDSGATTEQMSDTREAARDADLVLLVLDACSPGKKSDVETLDSLAAWFREQNRFKPPAIVAVVSKIDGLSPVMEWAPPYDWEKPTRPKERNIRAAMDYVKQSFGDRVDSIVPVCSAREQGRVYGFEEYLLPTLMLLLEEARAVSLVRSLHRDYDRQRAWQVVSQLASAGMKIREFAPEFAKQQLEMGMRSLLKTVTGK